MKTLGSITQIIAATALLSLLAACSDEQKPAEQETEETAQTQPDGMEQDIQEEELIEELIPVPEDTKKGIYVYFDGNATFTDCATGNKYPVAQEFIAPELQQTYLALQKTPQQKMLISVKGEYDERTSPESDEDLEMLIASELLGVVNSGKCQ